MSVNVSLQRHAGGAGDVCRMAPVGRPGLHTARDTAPDAPHLRGCCLPSCTSLPALRGCRSLPGNAPRLLSAISTGWPPGLIAGSANASNSSPCTAKNRTGPTRFPGCAQVVSVQGGRLSGFKAKNDSRHPLLGASATLASNRRHRGRYVAGSSLHLMCNCA